MSDILQLPELAARVSAPSLPSLVADSIKETIQRGRLAPGAQLPSEPELAAQLGVSRATVRHGLSILELEGLVVRHHGLGTFVSEVPTSLLKGGLAELTSTTDLIRSQGFEPGTTDLRISREKSPRAVATLLRLGEDEEVVQIWRTRTANRQPVIRCLDYVPARLLPERLLPTDEASSWWSLYETLAAAGSRPARAQCTVTPIVADAEIAGRLSLEKGQPLLLLKQLHYTQGGQPVLYCENWHNSALLEFQIMRRA